MIVNVTTRKTKSGNDKIVAIRLECDGCHTQYDSKRRTRDIKQETHWCSRECIGLGMRKSGKIRQLVEAKWMTNWGTVTPQSHPVVEAKRKATCMNRFGCTSPMQVAEHKELRKQNCIKKLGVDNVAKLDSTIEKMHATNLQRYGSKSPLKNPDVYAKVDWHEAVRKNHESMKRNGSYRKSRAEDKMYELLCAKFNDIERQTKPETTNWPVDFYVKSIDTWIQVDGVYWHGLDRPLEEHVTSGNPQSLSIIGKWHVDRAQDTWFVKRGMKLLRFTDKQVLAAKSIDELFRQVAGSATSTS